MVCSNDSAAPAGTALQIANKTKTRTNQHCILLNRAPERSRAPGVTRKPERRSNNSLLHEGKPVCSFSGSPHKRPANAFPKPLQCGNTVIPSFSTAGRPLRRAGEVYSAKRRFCCRQTGRTSSASECLNVRARAMRQLCLLRLAIIGDLSWCSFVQFDCGGHLL